MCRRIFMTPILLGLLLLGGSALDAAATVYLAVTVDSL